MPSFTSQVNKKIFVDVAICQAYGHQQFSQQVAIPDPWIEQAQSLGKASGNHLKTHPISQHVYFSGVPEANQLPNESDKAQEKYYAYQLSMKNNLKRTFNPKPQ